MDYGGERWWTARDRAVTGRMVQYLDKSESLQVGIEELEDCLLGPDELEFDIRHIALNARGEKHRRLFHTFSVLGLSDFFVASQRGAME